MKRDTIMPLKTSTQQGRGEKRNILKCLKACHTISFNKTRDCLESQGCLLSVANRGENQLVNQPCQWSSRFKPLHRQMLLAITAPELHRASCSSTYDRMPSVMCQGCQSLAWVRGGLWLHVTLSAAAGHMSNSDVNTMAYLISSGAFVCIFVKLHVPHLNLSSLCFQVVGSDTGERWWCVTRLMCCSKNFHRVFHSLREENPSFVFRNEVNRELGL